MSVCGYLGAGYCTTANGNTPWNYVATCQDSLAACEAQVSSTTACISWAAELEPRDADTCDEGDEEDDEELGRARGRRRGKPKAVVVRAPRALPVGAGDELWNWYESAGFGTSNPEEWARGEAQFLAQYGFSPWD